jgi:hypothetical protein
MNRSFIEEKLPEEVASVSYGENVSAWWSDGILEFVLQPLIVRGKPRGSLPSRPVKDNDVLPQGEPGTRTKC